MSVVIPCEICGLAPCMHDAQDVINFLNARVRHLEAIILAVAGPSDFEHPILLLYNEAIEIRKNEG